jgi:hypothetical protein
MTDEWLTRRLSVVNERVEPDPEFAEDLYLELAAELRLETGAGAKRGVPTRSTSRARRRIGPGLLLVAAIALATAAALGAGVGAFIDRNRPGEATALLPPHICDLIDPREIAAIIGEAVWLVAPESTVTSPASTTRSCVYRYGVVVPDRTFGSDITLSVSRYATPAAARDALGPGISPSSAAPPVGDATAFYMATPEQRLVVLRGLDMLLVGAWSSGAARGIARAQMEEIARRIVSRLDST